VLLWRLPLLARLLLRLTVLLWEVSPRVVSLQSALVPALAARPCTHGAPQWLFYLQRAL
jgi:hypothetical protein